MNHNKKARTILLTASVVLALGVTALAASYDSSEDPLISLSYLTNIFKPEIKEEYESRVAELESRLAALENGGIPSSGSSDDVPSSGNGSGVMDDGSFFGDRAEDAPSSETEEPVIDTTPAPDPMENGGSVTYEVVELSLGDALYAVSACDIMLRSGSAACIAPDASQGIANYTEGYEVYNDQAIIKNHMHLIPRGDGRGIKALSDSVFVMIRGDYTIVEG